MNLSRYCLALTLLYGVTASAADPIDLLHKDAAIVIRLKAPGTTVEDVAAFINQIQAGLGTMAQGQAGSLGLAINNPTLSGVDMSRDWYVMLFLSSQTPPQPVMVIPTTDAQEFKNALGNRFAVAVKDDWIVYSPDSNLLEAVKKGFDSSTDSITATQPDDLLQDFQKGHLGILINSPSLQSTFQNQLANAEQMLDRGLDEMTEELQRAGQQLPIEFIRDFYGDIGRWVIQAARDSTGVVFRIEVRDAELRIEERFTFTNSSKTQTALASHPVSPLAQLTSLPPNLLFYFAARFETAELIEWSKQVMASFVTDTKTLEQFRKSIEAMSSANFGTFAGAIDLSSTREAALSYMGITEVSPTKPVRDALVQLGNSLQYEIAGITQKITYRKNAEIISGRKIDHYDVEQTIPPEMDPLGIQSALNERMYGGDTIRQRLAFEDDRMLQMLGGTAEDMKLLLEPAEWTQTVLLEARKGLYPKANLVTLTDVPRLLLNIAMLVAESPSLPVPISVEQLAELVIQPTYAGTSISLENGELNARTNLPVAMFREITQSVFVIQRMLN